VYGVFTHIVGIVCPRPRSACQCSSSVNTKDRSPDEIPGKPWARKMKEFERYPVQCNTHRVPVYTQNIVPIISSPPSPSRTIQPVCEERVPMPQSACGEKHRACGVKTIDIFNHRNILENKKLNIFLPKYFVTTSQRKCQNIFFKHFIPSVSSSSIIIIITIRSMFKIPQNNRTRYPEFTCAVARLECRLQNVYVFVQLIYVYVLCKSSLIGYHQGAFGPVWQVHQNDDIREPFEKRNYLNTF